MSVGEDFHFDNLNPGLRQCPWCASYETVFHQRGYTGPTDEVNQYFTCISCHRVTYELIAKSSREMRLGRFRPGGVYRDAANQTRYQVSRVLKVGLNEYLVYLKPIVEQPGLEAAAQHR
jgi:hypothetical protein